MIEYVAIMISFKPVVSSLKILLPSNEDNVFYESIVAGLIVVALDVNDSDSSILDNTVSSISTITNNDNISYKIASIILDEIIGVIVSHFPDFDNAKYNNDNFKYTLHQDLDRVFIYVNKEIFNE